MAIICSSCKAENKDGARFCAKCGKELSGGAGTKPLTLSMLPIESTLLNYRVMGITYNNSEINQYNVVDMAPEGQRVAVCEDPSCGTYHQPFTGGPHERFCTQCGKQLITTNLFLILTESISPFGDNLRAIAQRNLAHPYLCMPLRVFDAGTASYLVTPKFTAAGDEMDIDKLFKDSVGLARALDVLHQNGISFEGQVGKAQMGMMNQHLVWANFSVCSVTPQPQPVQAAAACKDVSALAGFIYRSVSNETAYRPQTNLSQPMNDLLRRAIQEQSIPSAFAFVQAMEEALTAQSNISSVEFQVGRVSHVGMVRELNEDSMMTMTMNLTRQSQSQPRGVYAVADGMGGHAAGEVASGLIVETLAQKTSRDLFPAWANAQPVDLQKWLTEAVLEANKAVYTRGKGMGSDMGSTLVAVVMDGAKAHIAYVGDSRIYRVNNQGIEQLSTDHSLVERLVASGQITREEARNHAQKNVIYRTMGDKLNLDVDNRAVTLDPGDYLLLCSDGLSGMVEDKYLHQIIIRADSAQKACEDLIKSANAAGGDDNITAVVVKVTATSK